MTTSRVARTFPLRVALLGGEALDSWLEFLAYRHHTPPAVLLRYCGIHPQTFLHSWLVHPQITQFERLAAVTGTQPDDLIAATLHRYVGIEFGSADKRHRTRPTPWGWRSFSRWCPQCLGDDGGRWQIAWRLNWTFACLKHHRLLAEVCPRCGGRQRWGNMRAKEIPSPGRCARVYQDRARPAIVSCLADLTQAGGLQFGDTHPAMEAQKKINTLLAGEPLDLPVYQRSGIGPNHILQDIKTIARWAVSAASEKELQRNASSQLVGEVSRQSRKRPWDPQRRSSSGTTNPTPGEAAIGLIVATKIVSAQHIAESTRILAPLMQSARAAGRRVDIPAHATLTLPLRRIHATAQDSVLADRSI